MGEREVQEGGYVCIKIAGSLCCTAETSTTLYSNYIPTKKEKFGLDSGGEFFI